MKKRILSVLLVVSCLFLYMPQALANDYFTIDGEYDELVQLAEITTDIPLAPDSYIENIRDALYGGAALYGKLVTSATMPMEEAKFPYHVEFDFEEKEISLNYFVLHGYYTDEDAVTNFSIEYEKDGEWIPAVMGEYDNYRNTGSKVVNFDKPIVSNKFRLTIHEARYYYNRFRIWEVEMYGKVVGIDGINEIKSVKSNYYRLKLDENMPTPDSVVVLSEKLKEKVLQAKWDESEAPQKEGIYKTNGEILWFSDEARCVVDYFDDAKKINGSEGHWAEKNINFAVSQGWLGGVEKSASDGISREETGKIIWRALDVGMQFYEEGFSDIDKKSGEYDIFAALKEKGAYDSILSDKLDGKTSVSRLEAVKMIVNLKENQSVKTVSFNDVKEQDLEILEKAAAIGIISDGEKFYPENPIKLCELITMLVKAIGENIEITRTFTDTKEPLSNPYMGSFSYMVDAGGEGYDAGLGPDELYEEIPGVPVIYVRTIWKEFNPAPGVFDFSFIDALIQRCAKEGKQLAIRVQSFEGYEYTTPKWIYDLGARAQKWDYSAPTSRFSETIDDPDLWYTAPDYDDPIFTKYENEFYEEFGRRYDGNPYIAFVDTGIGLWGEGHTGNRTPPFSFEAIISRLEMMRRCFPTTDIVMMNELEKGVGDNRLKWVEMMEKAKELNIGYRNDTYYGNIGAHTPWMFLTIERRDAAEMSEYGPVVMELDHYGTVERLGRFGEDGIGIGKSIPAHKASYMGMHGYLRQMYEENPEFFKYCYLNLGYRIWPEQIKLSQKVSIAKDLTLEAVWQNNGSAQPRISYYPILTLVDEKGEIALVQVDTTFDVSKLEVAEVEGDSTIINDINRGSTPKYIQNTSFKINKNVKPGEYKVYISLGTKDGEAKLYMPVSDHDGNKKYYIGKISVEEAA